jgi:hypothetical protein
MIKLTLSALAVVATTILTLTAGPAGGAGEPAKIEYRDTFTTQEPGRSSGRVFSDVLTNPDNPDGKPPAVAHVHTELPAGAHFDTGAVPACTASDAEIVARGPSACPAASKVGTNDFVTDSGVSGSSRYTMVHADFFNERGGLIIVASTRGTNLVFHGRIEGNRFDFDQPPLPGTPPDGGAMKSEQVVFFEAVGAGGRGYITTPPTCPASGVWRFRYEFTFRDGRKQTATSDQPCQDRAGSGPDGTAPPSRRLRIRIRGVPRRCTTRSFNVRVRISGGSALRRVRVYRDRKRIATHARRSFRLRIAPLRLRSGRHRLRIHARDRAGRRAERTATFRRC